MGGGYTPSADFRGGTSGAQDMRIVGACAGEPLVSILVQDCQFEAAVIETFKAVVVCIHRRTDALTRRPSSTGVTMLAYLLRVNPV